MAEMFWIFVEPGQVSADSVEITDGKARHLARVLRVRAGEQGVAVCGGREYHLEVARIEPGRVTGRVLTIRPNQSEPLMPVTLLQALLRNPDFDAVIEGTTAVGVTRIVPVTADRSVVRPAAARLQRWRTVAESAAEQSRRGRVPEVTAPATLRQAITMVGGSHLLVLDPYAKKRLPAAGARDGEQAIAIGPEGGWTDQELLALTEAGGMRVTLGPRILRARLAPIVAAAILIQHS